MPKSTEKGKKKYANTYKWTDDEILGAYSAHYPSPEDAAAIGKDFPHKKDELTKSVLTSKLKAI
ncbi:unnamed protein product [Pocillopora meandrina]|uniref:Uncharacterized protein n=1 Tax=Pocillopora meandrina TaxID=46732 RepID=A0AAU9VN47_9CNID|nr:unnamed protein product [Pocillopora meandrina]